jgi:membrane protein
VRRLASAGPVVTARRILDRYGAAGGGLLAGGLAYAALVAIVPAILLVAGIAGILVQDPAARDDVASVIANVVPPLGDLIKAILAASAEQAAPVTVIGAVALVWGASRFVVAFQDCLARVMEEPKRRGLLASNAAAFLAVVAMIAAVLSGALLAAFAAFLDAAETNGVLRIVGQALSLVLAATPFLSMLIAMVLVYRLAPLRRPPWQALLPPALVVGVGLTALGRVFVFLAPRLIGSAALLGALATAFAALAWLSLSFQLVLLGAAWVRDQENAIQERASMQPSQPATPAGEDPQAP